MSERAGVDESDADYYARAILDPVGGCVPAGEVSQPEAPLADEFDPRFEFVGQEATRW